MCKSIARRLTLEPVELDHIHDKIVLQNVFGQSLTKLSLGLSPGGFTASKYHDSLQHHLNQCRGSAIRFDLRNVFFVQSFQCLGEEQ